MMKKLISLLFLVLMFCAVSSCDKKEIKPEEPQGYSRVVMVYMVSENSLGIRNDGLHFDKDDIKEMLSGSRLMADDEKIVLYLDDEKNPAIYTITNKTKAISFSELTPEYSYSENRNSASGEMLTEFFDYVKKNHSANSYGIVFWSHGSGWIPSNFEGDSQSFSKRRKAFGIDNGKDSTSDSGNRMSIGELRDALRGFGTKMEFLMFDCCFMQCVELDYELKDLTKYIVGSTAEIPGPGANYISLVQAMFSKDNYAAEMPLAYYNAYKSNADYGVLISTVDCGKLEALMTATRNVFMTHKDELLSMSYEGVQDYFIYDKYRNQSAYPDFYDMNAIFKKLLPENEYKIWKQYFDDAVPHAYATDFWVSIYMYHGDCKVNHDQYGGVSMYVPLEKYTTGFYAAKNQFFTDGYYSSKWCKDVWKGTNLY